jgi:hypothetical protein
VLLLSSTSRAQAASGGTGRAPLTVAQMRADLASFRSDIFTRDNSYSAASRAAAEARLQQLEGAIERITPVAFEVALAQIVALADNGHTLAFPSVRARRYNRVPVRLTPFGDEFRVLRTTETNADLLGARLVAIDGRAILVVRDSARTMAGGTPARRDRDANYLMESPELLRAFGLATDGASATYTFEALDGRRIERRLTGGLEEAGAPRGNADRWLYPELLPAEDGKWRALLPVDKAPWSLREPDRPFRWRAAPEIDAMVVQLRRTFTAPGNSITEFLDEMTRTITTVQPRNLVLDMRLNGGGNLNTARAFMKSLPTLVPGRIFVLTSPWTFSAAISSVGYLEQASPDRVTIVGEEVGDRLEFFAEGGPTTLAHSGIMIGIATQRHDYRNGCRDLADCHGPVVSNPIAVPTLAPDIAAPWTIAAYREGRDPTMEAVAAALRRP